MTTPASAHAHIPSTIHVYASDLKKVLERKDRDKRTALWWAACNGHADIVRLLLQHGAIPHVKDADKRTPGALPPNRHPPNQHRHH